MGYRWIRTIIKGFCVGSTMLVPGVSGGSMAMILGEYDKLVTSVSSFLKHKRESVIFLGLFSAGGAAGMVLLAKPLLYLIEKYPFPMLYFFIGAVVGGIPSIYKKSGVEKLSLKIFLYLSVGTGIVTLISIFSYRVPSGYGAEQAGGTVWLAAAGIGAAAALVLPGISVSYLFLIMGIYPVVMNALGSFQLNILLPLCVGLFIGIIATTKTLEWMMRRYPTATYMTILGFVLGSAAEIFPGLPKGIYWIVCPAMTALGYLLIRAMSRFDTADSGGV